MTESQIKTSLTDLNSLVLNGNLMDAFEKYYHEEIEMQENSNPAVKGKDTNRKKRAWIPIQCNGIQEGHGKRIGRKWWHFVRYLELRLHTQRMGRQKLYPGVGPALEERKDYQGTVLLR